MPKKKVVKKPRPRPSYRKVEQKLDAIMETLEKIREMLLQKQRFEPVTYKWMSPCDHEYPTHYADGSTLGPPCMKCGQRPGDGYKITWTSSYNSPIHIPWDMKNNPPLDQGTMGCCY